MWEPDLYLVAHKLFGSPTLDVAVKIDQGTPTDAGPWWINPTSGHRLYPYWTHKMSELFAYTNIGDPPEGIRDVHEEFQQEMRKAHGMRRRSNVIEPPTAEDL